MILELARDKDIVVLQGTFGSMPSDLKTIDQLIDTDPQLQGLQQFGRNQERVLQRGYMETPNGDCIVEIDYFQGIADLIMINATGPEKAAYRAIEHIQTQLAKQKTLLPAEISTTAPLQLEATYRIEHYKQDLPIWHVYKAFRTQYDTQPEPAIGRKGILNAPLISEIELACNVSLANIRPILENTIKGPIKGQNVELALLGMYGDHLTNPGLKGIVVHTRPKKELSATVAYLHPHLLSMIAYTKVDVPEQKFTTAGLTVDANQSLSTLLSYADNLKKYGTNTQSITDLKFLLTQMQPILNK